MAKQVLPLEGESVNGISHAPETSLRGTDQVFISDDLVDELLLGQALEFILCVGLLKLPFSEVHRQGVVHPVDNLYGFCLRSFSLAHIGLQLVECFRNDREVAILEEERDDSLLHVGSLLTCLRGQVLVNLLWFVAHLD